MASDVSFKYLADLTPGFTGADLGGLVREASLQALKQSLRECQDGPDDESAVLLVNSHHFEEALKNIKPSVTEEVSLWTDSPVDGSSDRPSSFQDKRNYERLEKLYGAKERDVV